LLTVFDPFDVIGSVSGRDKKERYWEGHQRVVPKSNGTPKAQGVEQVKFVTHCRRRTPWSLFTKAFWIIGKIRERRPELAGREF